jgi:hypothetical protein
VQDVGLREFSGLDRAIAAGRTAAEAALTDGADALSGRLEGAVRR